MTKQPTNRAKRRRAKRVRVAPVPREPAPGKLAFAVEETAWVLGIGVSTTWELIRQGKLGSFRVGRRVLVAKSECERFMADGGVAGPVDPRSQDASA